MHSVLELSVYGSCLKIVYFVIEKKLLDKKN